MHVIVLVLVLCCILRAASLRPCQCYWLGLYEAGPPELRLEIWCWKERNAATLSSDRKIMITISVQNYWKHCRMYNKKPYKDEAKNFAWSMWGSPPVTTQNSESGWPLAGTWHFSVLIGSLEVYPKVIQNVVLHVFTCSPFFFRSKHDQLGSQAYPKFLNATETWEILTLNTACSYLSSCK